MFKLCNLMRQRTSARRLSKFTGSTAPQRPLLKQPIGASWLSYVMQREIMNQHLSSVLGSVSMIANGQDNEVVAAIDVSIGDIYLSLCCFDEAVFAYQKALTVFKTTRSENHGSVALIYIRLADLYYKTGKLRESKSYCENALRIYSKPVPGTTPDEIASGLTEISAIYDALNEPEEALKLLQKAMKLLEDSAGQYRTIAGIEAQMAVMFYTVGRFVEARDSFQSAITKLRAGEERNSAFFGVLLNQQNGAGLCATVQNRRGSQTF